MIIIIGFPKDQTIIHTLTVAERSSIPYIFFDLGKFASFGDYYWNYGEHRGHFGYENLRFQLPDSDITGIYSRTINVFAGRKDRRARLLASRIQALSDIL